MSTSIDGGSRAVALLADDEDDWFATPQRQRSEQGHRVEQEVLPWDSELEWQLREPESLDLGRRQAALVLAVVVAVFLVFAGILIGRATKHPATKIVTATPTTQAEDTSSAGTGDSSATSGTSGTSAATGSSSSGTETPSTSTDTPSTTAETSGAVPTDAKLQTGSKGAAVTALQNALTTLGYAAGTADGTYGATTAQAVSAFQAANELPADGIAGAATLAAINTAAANASSSSESTSDTNSVPTDAKLQGGSKGAGVIALQKALTTLGYASGTADGTYGTTTAQAVTAFQTAKGLTADGVAGVKTLAAINAALASG